MLVEHRCVTLLLPLLVVVFKCLYFSPKEVLCTKGYENVMNVNLHLRGDL